MQHFSSFYIFGTSNQNKRTFFHYNGEQIQEVQKVPFLPSSSVAACEHNLIWIGSYLTKPKYCLQSLKSSSPTIQSIACEHNLIWIGSYLTKPKYCLQSHKSSWLHTCGLYQSSAHCNHGVRQHSRWINCRNLSEYVLSFISFLFSILSHVKNKNSQFLILFNYSLSPDRSWHLKVPIVTHLSKVVGCKTATIYSVKKLMGMMKHTLWYDSIRKAHFMLMIPKVKLWYTSNLKHQFKDFTAL